MSICMYTIKHKTLKDRETEIKAKWAKSLGVGGGPVNWGSFFPIIHGQSNKQTELDGTWGGGRGLNIFSPNGNGNSTEFSMFPEISAEETTHFLD